MIKKTVLKLVKTYKTNNPFEIAEYKNINVIPWDLHEDIKGFYRYIRRNKFIFYNENIHEHEKKFVCAHELGHAILHPRESTPFMRTNTLFSTNKIEIEANTFAVELLIPDSELKDFHHQSIYGIARIFGVPKEVVFLKKTF